MIKNNIMMFLLVFTGFPAPSLVVNPLNGQHLRVIWPPWKGNPPGLAGAIASGDILEYLAARFNFTYEMVRVTENTMEPSVNGKGFQNYILDGQCDLLMADVLATSRRLALVDFTLPWVDGPVAFLIPVANEAININAVSKPFQWPVWLLLGISTISVIFVLTVLQLSYYQQSNSSTIITRRKKRGGRAITKTAGHQYRYVFGALLSQGDSCKEKRISFRIAAGAWVLGAFVLVQAYQSILFSYIISPIPSPLINSVYDLAESKDINFLVRKGGTFEYFFKSTNKTLYKKVQAIIDASPRCGLTSDCVKMITAGSRNVYADAREYLELYIDEEFRRTGKCNLQIARDDFLSFGLSYALPKNSPYTNTMSIGVLEIQQLGLRKFWYLTHYPAASHQHCRSQKGYKAPKSQPALTLKNLTGAFIVLLVGLALSLIAFIYEKMHHYLNVLCQN